MASFFYGSPSPYLFIITEHHGQRSVLRLLGELDIRGKALLRDAISSALEHGPQVLEADLSELAFMDCSGLAVLVDTHRRLAEDQRKLVITGSRPIVRRLITLAGLDAYLHQEAPVGASVPPQRPCG